MDINFRNTYSNFAILGYSRSFQMAALNMAAHRNLLLLNNPYSLNSNITPYKASALIPLIGGIFFFQLFLRIVDLQMAVR